MPALSNNRILRVAILQRVLPQYRISLFRLISSTPGVTLRIFIGSDIPHTKVRSAKNFLDLDVIKLRTLFVRFLHFSYAFHFRLLRSLAAFKPDVVLCEGESNLISYLKAFLYRLFFPDVALVHWSLGGLPGSPDLSPTKMLIKRILLRIFDSYLVYSSFGRDHLIKLGCCPTRVFVSVNVSDTNHHLSASRHLTFTKEQALSSINLPVQFTILYVGTLESDKRLDVLIRSLAELRFCNISLVCVGDGPSLNHLQSLASSLGLRDVFFPGRVPWDLMSLYYRAASVFVLPGRGGMVISEAMCHGLPVIVFQLMVLNLI